MADTQISPGRYCGEACEAITGLRFERHSEVYGRLIVDESTEEGAFDSANSPQECQTSAGVPFQLAASPVQFDEHSVTPIRAPELNEHGDAIFEELDFDWDAIVDLKVRGVVA
jgi:crotonobetainyl-CoA:carnitine CoA-transferase CaiB-like acyl-CoA transferase